MRKTLLMMAVMASFGMSHAHAEEQWIAHDRTNWSISGCSQYGHGSDGNSNDGSLDKIIDAPDATIGSGNKTEVSYWHSDWDHDTATSGHFFIIDRGQGAAGTPFSAFGFTPRQTTNGNGYLTNYSIYVVDDIAGITTVSGDGQKYDSNSHSSLATFLTGKTAAKTGSTGFTYGSVSSELRVKFDEQQTGRFVIVVFNSTTGNPSNQHANCADFRLYDVWEKADRSGWSISGCSQYGDTGEGNDGPLSYIIDDNINTFWHSNWTTSNGDASNATTTDKPHAHHFFIIDRGDNAADKPFDCFGYLPRQGNNGGANGFLKDYSMYVVDDITGISTVSGAGAKGTTSNHETLDAFLADKTAITTGSVTTTINPSDGEGANTHYERKVKLDAVQTGRYVIFVFEKTTGAQDPQNNNNHANCAEFYLYNTAVVPAPVEPQPVDPKAEALSKLESMKKAPLIWSNIDEAKAQINELPDDATSAQIDEILAGVYDSAIGRTLTLYNVSSATKCLIGQGSNVNVVESSGNATNLAIYWTIKGTANHGVYQLENHGLGTLVGFPGSQNTVLPLGSTGADFEIIVPTEVDNGASIAENQIVFRSINHHNQQVSCIHLGNGGVMGWEAISAGTQWRAYAPYAANVTVELSAANDWTISGTGIALNATRNANHKLTITPVTSAMTREVTYPHEVELTAKEDGSGFKMNMANVAAGEYTLQAPLGFFTLHDGAMPSQAINQTIVHQGTTSISEVSADEPAATEWYDLSGRRVANPTKGFYINNCGQKIRR